jgi:hypothetical protein
MDKQELKDELEAQDVDPEDATADPDAIHVDDAQGGEDAPGPTTMGGDEGEALETSQQRELGDREPADDGDDSDDDDEELDAAGEPILRGDALEAKGKELGISGWSSLSADEKRAAVAEAEG